ncbi:histidine phosphatase family protein [Novosphingobium sp. FSY-8]|uniref:Histidine phosphatase family protein n=1 Tax=Novosphingobium ovatum TaxID=1908523 RepID=A0ABW9XB42_9SPHN|nr:histidine phosphatase family protein [Novosphingobium ovatum]NBC35749.1 histidine phosphatase family protein [Novosphingobium ovatum]
MKTLGLFRHAKSDWSDARARDFDRPLNRRGQLGAPLMGRHIRDYCAERGMVWNKVMSSPAVRAAQTIEMAAAGAGMDAGHSFPISWDRRIYLASSASLADVLREQSDTLNTILMVGHNPGLEDLIFDLVPDDGSSPLRDVVEAKFPTATFAVLDIDIDRWADLDERQARLVHLMRPRDLDAALGPEVFS